MTNYEKYKDELIKKCITSNRCTDRRQFILEKLGKACGNEICSSCTELVEKWLEAEYEEPTVDWSKVEVDTQIFVFDLDEWIPRHFAKFEGGKVYAWNDGRTSFSSKYCAPWPKVKLAEDGGVE